MFYRLFVKAEAFRAEDTCIGCGKCVELCPLNNIHLENGKPVWGKTHCMACICYCPKEAIEYGKKSKNTPGITLKHWKRSRRTYEVESTPAAGNGRTAVKLTLQELEAAAGAEGWVDVCKEPEGE